MPHAIILEGIDQLQGENVTGDGVLEELKGYMPSVEACEEIPSMSRSREQRNVLDQAEVIAGLFENGFTSGGLATETASLGTLIGAL